MKRNTDPQFVGVGEIKRQQAKQLAAFEQWAAQGNWGAFHHAHYDWWMFPIDKPSSYGMAYVVYAGDIAELQQDPVYIANYLRGVELLMLAWGWDAAKRQPVANPQPGQQWSQWPIRLHKAASSLLLFGFSETFESLRAYALTLLAAGQSFAYNGRDLALLFTAPPQP